jgi:O-antigen/teichoic acid export membrane protein
MSTEKFLKNSGIYVIVSILQKAMMFFLLPLYTSYLSPDDYGILNVITSITSLLSMFFLLSLNGAAIRFHYNNVHNELKIKKIWGTLCTFVVINSLVLGSVFILSHKYLLEPFAKGIDFYPYLFLGILTTIVTPLYLFFQTYLQTIQNGIRFGVNIMFNFLLNVGLVILFVVGFEKGVLGVLWANLITAVVFFIYAIFAFFRKLDAGLKKEVLHPAFRYSLPLLPHSVFSWIMSMIDRVFLNNLKGKTETGLYSVGYQFGNIVGILTTAVNQAYVPWFFEQEKQGEQGRARIVKIAETLTVIYCFIALVISLFSPEILRIMVTEKYRMAWKYIPFISFAYVFRGLYYFYVSVLFLKETKWVPIITFSAASIGLLLNIFLIPVLGGIGAGISSIISLFICSIISLLLSQKADHSIKFKWVRMYFFTGLFFLLAITLFIVPDNFDYLYAFLIKIFFITALFTGCCYLYRKNVIFIREIVFKFFK